MAEIGPEDLRALCAKIKGRGAPATAVIAREIVKLGGQPIWREGVVTDNGNWILDVHGWSITDPVKLESDLNAIVGVVTNGLFAARPADLVIAGGEVRA